MNKITVFLPMRKGSERIKNKNIKDFANIKGGLTYIKLSQLLKVESIDKILVSTDDEEVKKIVKSFNNNKIKIDHRIESLASSATSTDDLITYASTIITEGIILWTHVTSPFITEKIYEQVIKNFKENQDEYDSLMTVTQIQKFIWNNNEPITYDRTKEKWPRTQTIRPLYEINSGVFLAHINIYKKYKDRIGEKPLFYELNEKEAYDIDWKENFEIAEILWEKYNYSL